VRQINISKTVTRYVSDLEVANNAQFDRH